MGLTYVRHVKRVIKQTPVYLKSSIGMGRPKVFVIGRNKTGTTSLAHYLKSCGYSLGNQRQASLLIEDWGRRDFRRIASYCKTADAFQDIPFSLDYTYQAMDSAFPASRFILTVRDSSDQWFQSVLRYMRKQNKRRGYDRVPTSEDMKTDPYIYSGWLWRVEQLMWGADRAEDCLFDEAVVKKHYEDHNSRVIDFFRHRTEDLLVVNVADADSAERISDFIGFKSSLGGMPKLNASS